MVGYRNCKTFRPVERPPPRPRHLWRLEFLDASAPTGERDWPFPQLRPVLWNLCSVTFSPWGCGIRRQLRGFLPSDCGIRRRS